MKQSFTVRDLPEQERPRERLQNLGAEALSVQELVALVLGRGAGGESVMATAQKLLSQFGSLEGITRASLEDLQSTKGIGLAKAAQLKACLEIARRSGALNDAVCEKRRGQKGMFSPSDVYAVISPKISGYAKEHFFVLSFDARNMLLGADMISVGTLTASLVHARETFDAAIRRHASHIILAHNHPSGDTAPSIEDIETTRRLVQAGNILGIELADHIIVGEGGFTSMKERQFL